MNKWLAMHEKLTSRPIKNFLAFIPKVLVQWQLNLLEILEDGFTSYLKSFFSSNTVNGHRAEKINLTESPAPASKWESKTGSFHNCFGRESGSETLETSEVLKEVSDLLEKAQLLQHTKGKERQTCKPLTLKSRLSNSCKTEAQSGGERTAAQYGSMSSGWEVSDRALTQPEESVLIKGPGPEQLQL